MGPYQSSIDPLQGRARSFRFGSFCLSLSLSVSHFFFLSVSLFESLTLSTAPPFSLSASLSTTPHTHLQPPPLPLLPSLPSSLQIPHFTFSETGHPHRSAQSLYPTPPLSVSVSLSICPWRSLCPPPPLLSLPPSLPLPLSLPFSTFPKTGLRQCAVRVRGPLSGVHAAATSSEGEPLHEMTLTSHESDASSSSKVEPPPRATRSYRRIGGSGTEGIGAPHL